MRISDTIKFDTGLVGQTINNTNVTGRYFSLEDAERVCAVLIGGALASGKKTKVELLQAQDEAGTGAKAITNASAELTSPTKVTECTLTLANVANADIVKINGLTFTAHTDTTTKASRQFKIDGDDTADAAALAGLINDATYGVPGVVAAAALGVITLRATDGAKTITVAEPAATITVATTKSMAYVNANAADLDSAGGFKYVAAKVTSDGNGINSVALLRSGFRHSPSQAVGASASV